MKTAAFALALGLVSATAGMSATIQAAFWDAPSSFKNVDAAIEFAQNTAASATFQSSMIDYPNVGKVVRSNRTSLADFLGRMDALTLDGDGGATLNYSVFRFTGVLDLDAGIYEMTVGSDDGFRLIFTEDEIDRTVAERARPRAFRDTTEEVQVSGDTAFTLWYYENQGRTGVTFSIDGDVVDTTDLTVAAIPLPAGFPLLLAGLAGLGWAAERSRSQPRRQH